MVDYIYNFHIPHKKKKINDLFKSIIVTSVASLGLAENTLDSSITEKDLDNYINKNLNNDDLTFSQSNFNHDVNITDGGHRSHRSHWSHGSHRSHRSSW